MKTFDLKDKKGRVFAFEVDSLMLGRQGVCKVVSAIPNVRITRRPKRFQLFAEETFCEFEIDGKRFKVLEPWGDNSRYWIGPNHPKWCKQVEKIKKAFARFRAVKARFYF